MMSKEAEVRKEMAQWITEAMQAKWGAMKRVHGPEREKLLKRLDVLQEKMDGFCTALDIMLARYHGTTFGLVYDLMHEYGYPLKIDSNPCPGEEIIYNAIFGNEELVLQ